MVDLYHLVLALHVIAVIAFMAGMLYIWRLYVYHTMATEPVVQERLQVMERRLLNLITTPALVAMVVFGVWLLVLNPVLLKQPWMHIKLTLVLGMGAVHGMALKHRRKLVEDPHYKPDRFYRIMNEIPTVLMIGIVLAVILKPFAR